MPYWNNYLEGCKMDIRQLIYFSEVARQRSFSKASGILHVSQPTISKNVKQIEEELEVTLLDRSTKLVQLTDAGHVVFRQSLKIIQDFSDLSAELADVLNLQIGNIKIGLPPMVGASFFPEVMAGFNYRYPKISIQLIEVGAVAVAQQVQEGSLDLGAIVLPVPNRTELSYYQLYEDSLMLVVNPEHRLAKSTQVSLDQLRNELFILYRSDFSLHHHIREQCVKFGFEPQIIYESSQWDFMSRMVEANLGIALLPRTICQKLNPERIISVPLTEPVIPWNIGLVWRKDKYLSYATREFIKFACYEVQR